MAEEYLFLKLGDIKGMATSKNFEKQIVLQHISYSIHQAGNWETGETKSGRITTFGDLSCTKLLDQSSPTLALACAMKDHFDKVEISVSAGTADAYYKVTLEKVLITNITNVINAGDSNPIESLTLSFRRMRWEYNTVREGYDIDKKEKM
jgi:type VI secretion system secreted protein Hcp